MNSVKYNDDSKTVTLTTTMPVDRYEMPDAKAGIEKQQERVKSFFIAAGFEVAEMFKLENQYWPLAYDYLHVRALNPWWLVETQYGKIIYGRRKNVVNIDWSHTKYRGDLLEEGDSTTSGDDFVHCWEREHVVRELTTLHKRLREMTLEHSRQD